MREDKLLIRPGLGQTRHLTGGALQGTGSFYAPSCLFLPFLLSDSLPCIFLHEFASCPSSPPRFVSLPAARSRLAPLCSGAGNFWCPSVSMRRSGCWHCVCCLSARAVCILCLLPPLFLPYFMRSLNKSTHAFSFHIFFQNPSWKELTNGVNLVPLLLLEEIPTNMFFSIYNPSKSSA